MLRWIEAVIAAVFALTLLVTIIIVILIMRRRSVAKKLELQLAAATTELHPQAAAFKTLEGDRTRYARRTSYSMFPRRSPSSAVASTKGVFDWADHPKLITEAVENGWSQFAFTNYASSPSVRLSLFRSLRVAGDRNLTPPVEFTWEVGQGTVDFMQKIRFNRLSNNHTSAKSTVRMALPLPGPHPSFPQEAYFEITLIRNSDGDGCKSMAKIKNGEEEIEKAKLIHQNVSTSSSQSVILRTGSHALEELKFGGNVNSKRRNNEEAVKMSLGLTVGGSPFLTSAKMPGTYPGSVGFNSNGSVFLSGMKLAYESESGDWSNTGKVIGCGYDPSKKKVFFTLDSELMHVIHCKSDDFLMPLYPVIAANVEISVLVNLGQSKFKYSEANAQRTANPCFINPVMNSTVAALGDDDSREFFSIGRINAEWLNHSAVNNRRTDLSSSRIFKMNDSDGELEADLFEIVLDTN